jgi:signal transduction histidine kinase
VECYLPVIERGLLRIRAIVQDLLIEQRAQNASETRGPACLDEVRDLIFAEVDGRGVVLNWDDRVSDRVLVNRERLQPAVLNLLQNAVQAMPDGGRLRFSATVEDRALCAEIEDTGVGIFADDLPLIFDPFFSSKKNGTGLGLWITSRLLQSMGGSIEVSSTPGVGTLFRIRVPVEEAADGPANE